LIKDTDIVTLIKPQFEVGKDEVGKGGIVRSDEARANAVNDVTSFFLESGLYRKALIPSPITGTDGNIEYLAHWKMK
jgi:23S rRNA (cytidine1920-2'-O)/16S rRNA (cytidine1409-2'-O)-methyltransferase